MGSACAAANFRSKVSSTAPAETAIHFVHFCTDLLCQGLGLNPWLF